MHVKTLLSHLFWLYIVCHGKDVNSPFVFVGDKLFVLFLQFLLTSYPTVVYTFT